MLAACEHTGASGRAFIESVLVAYEAYVRTFEAARSRRFDAGTYVTLGAALGAKRKDVVISTKVGFRTDPAMLHQGLSRQNILAECDNSLRRLGTDYIDIYLVHRVDLNTPIEETVAARQPA